MEYILPCTVPHLCWLSLIAVNFLVQIGHFRRPENRRLFIARKITTPLMLFSGLAVIGLTAGADRLVPILILAAMGVGELGIEGSSAVDSQGPGASSRTPWTVVLAGALFLGVNVFLGVVLLVDRFTAGESAAASLAGGLIGLTAVAGTMGALLRIHHPAPPIRSQIIIYAGGLAVLAAGAGAALAGTGGAPGRLGWAGIILTVSDSLVLWRMGTSWNPQETAGRRKLAVFLVIILLLYYLYIGTVISTAAPFRTA